MSRHWLLVMTRLQIIFLVLLPLCSAQFSIKGPSDGNRRAQGLKYSQDKGIEYEDQRASLGAGDFSIQGASDGNSDFHIQGASDGNSDFQIQGATDGNSDFHIQGATDGNANFQIQGATDGNANFHIQGATDSNADFRIQGPTDANVNYQVQGAAEAHAQPVVQRPYDANQGGGRALQYRDPSGLNVNWKSYQNAPQHPPQHAPQNAIQPTHNAFIPHDAVIPQAPRRQPARQHAASAESDEQPIPKPNYRPYDNAPSQIKQLLQFQQQIPYLNIIPEQYRYDGINNQQPQAPAAQPEYEARPQKAQPRRHPDEQNQYRSQYRGKSRGPARQRREAQGHQQQQHRNTQPPAEPQPHYSANVPSKIQDLLKFQAQIPYVNHIPEKWRYDALAAAQNQKQEYTPQYQSQGQQPAEGGHRQRRQAPHRQQSQIRQYRQHQQQPQQHQQQQQQHQQQQQQQQPASQPQYQRISQPPAESQPHYSTNLPAHLQQLLKFQAQTPYVNSIPEKFRYENLAAAQAQHAGQQPQYQPGGHGRPRQKRQAQYQQQQKQQQPQQQQPQYQRISQPPAEPQPQYSNNVPGSIQKLLQFQSQTPYNIIANQITYRLDKPYVPQRVQAPEAAPPQYQPQQQSAGAPYQGQPGSQPQGQPVYQPQGRNVRPVNEKQY